MTVVLEILFPLFAGGLIGLILLGAPRRSKKPEFRTFAEAMSRIEALQLLGFDGEPGAEAVRAAHRRLMARYHPDHGGSHENAARLNRARDLLLGKR